MRNELLEASNNDYFCYGLSLQDFDYTKRLVSEFISAAHERLDGIKAEAIAKHPSPDIHSEIISDYAHYLYVDTQYLWHFCIWRFQAIFEGIISDFLGDTVRKPLIGLKAKLDATRNTGFHIDDSDYEECLAWGRLRNAFSHAPPEQYRPVEILDSDISSLYELLVRLVTNLTRKKEAEQDAPSNGDKRLV